MLQEYRIHLKSANGPIEVYLCPDSIDEDASVLAAPAGTHTGTASAQGALTHDQPSSYSVEKQQLQGTMCCFIILLCGEGFLFG